MAPKDAEAEKLARLRSLREEAAALETELGLAPPTYGFTRDEAFGNALPPGEPPFWRLPEGERDEPAPIDGPLKGVVVLDLTRILAGPHCAKMVRPPHPPPPTSHPTPPHGVGPRSWSTSAHASSQSNTPRPSSARRAARGPRWSTSPARTRARSRWCWTCSRPRARPGSTSSALPPTSSSKSPNQARPCPHHPRLALPVHPQQQSSSTPPEPRPLVADRAPARAQCLTALACVRYNSYRPGVMARLGFGWEELHAAHPHLVMCSISGFGQVRPSLFNCPLDSSILPVFPWTFAVLLG